MGERSGRSKNSDVSNSTRIRNKGAGRGRAMSGSKRRECSKGKGSASRGLWVVNADSLKERNLLKATKRSFLSSFFES